MKKRSQKRNEGMALVMATILVAVTVLILGAMSMRTISQSNQVTQYERFTETFNGLESATNASMADLETQGDGAIGLGTWTGGGASLPSFASNGVTPVTLDMSSTQYMAYAQNWGTDAIDNNGDGTVDDLGETDHFTVHSFASNGGVQRQSETVLRADGLSVWDNAIFAGAGQAGGLINGNVSIHGSVHLLGENLVVGGVALAALDLSGTSLIHNNYEGLNAGVRARVPALPTRTFNGENVETLSAKLRVKNGRVGLSGNSEIGEPNIAGNAWKETMDGTYVNSGWTGNAVTDDGDRGDPNSVFSDNAWDEAYDLGDLITMPVLSDDYRDMFTGATTVNPATGANYTHAEYFEEVLASTPYPGNATIACNANFFYNATDPADTNPANRLPTDDYVYFNAATNVMEINGQIQIDGDLTLKRGSGNDGTINYTGRGAILVNGNAVLNTDLLSRNSNGTTANSYPVNNCFGIMTSGNMAVGTTAQLTLMGAFYAQGQITCSKQSTIMGTFVSNFFDMGTNVPDIYQVPELADNLPLGMIGAYPILRFSPVSWREIGVA